MTNIEWTHWPKTDDSPARTGESWNPVVGCTKCGVGCEHCYAERMAVRLAGMGTAHYPEVVTDGKWNGEVQEVGLWKLNQPKYWRKPRVVFVCSMSDLFHPQVHDTHIQRCHEVVRGCSWHVFIVLTKRIERARSYYKEQHYHKLLPNLILGVSVSTQAEADRDLPILADIPVACRMVSLEPLVEQVTIARHLSSLHWVIVGGESGPGARTFDFYWAEWLRDECSESEVPFFLKQGGSAPAWDDDPPYFDRHFKVKGKGGDPNEWPGGAEAWPREVPEL